MTRTSMEDPDDNDPIFRKGWKPKKTPKVPASKVKRVWRKKRLPQPTRLDKATLMIQTGATEVNLMRLDLEANMDAKLASVIMDVATQPHVVSLELQAIYFILATYLS